MPPSWANLRHAAALALGLACLGFGHEACSAEQDTYTVVRDRADDTVAIRERSIVRSGDIVRFQLVDYSPEPEKFRFGLRSVKANFAVFEMEFNCKTWAIRPIRLGVLKPSDMSVVKDKTIDADWEQGATWVFYFYACSAEPRSPGQRLQFPDAVSFAVAAPSLRQAAIKRDAEYQATHAEATHTGWVIDGIDPLSCKTPEGRRAAVRDLEPAARREFDRFDPVTRDEALLQKVVEICASVTVLGGRDPFAEPDLIPTRYWRALDREDCKSAWNGTCTATVRLSVPDGYQVCSKKFRQDGRGYEFRVDVAPATWIEESPKPRKFRAYDVTLYSSGGNRPLNRKSANIKVSDFVVTYISDRLDNDQRRKRGCEMPAVPVPVPVPKPSPTLPFAQNSIAFPRTSRAERFRLVMTAPAHARTNTHFLIEVFDSFIDNRWEPFWEETIPLGPGGTYDFEHLKYGATCWRFKSEYWTDTGWRPGQSFTPNCK